MAILSIFLHLHRFPEVPNGFFYDESSVGYNAYSLAETGADEYGVRYPVFFRCFDNYQDPLTIYLLAIPIKILGLQIRLVRLPSFLFLALGSLILYFPAKILTKSRWTALFTSFAYSIIPWTYVLSRTGVGGYMAMLAGTIAGFYFLHEAMAKKSFPMSIAAAFGWSLAVYSHHIGKLMPVMILLSFLLAYNVLIWKRLKYILLFCALLFILMLPMFLSIIGNPESMTARFSTFKIWYDNPGFMETAQRFFSRYLEYFSPSFLFLVGDSDLRHNTNASGELYIFMAPFVLLGIYRMIRGFRHNPLYRFLLLTILVYPTAASLTMDRMHSTRCLNGAPFFCLAMALGIEYASVIIKRRGFRFNLALPIAALLGVEAFFYFKNYFGEYAVLSRSSFNAPLVESIQKCFSEKKEGETLYVSSSAFHHPVDKDFKPVWYSHFLFFGKIDPAIYQKEGIPDAVISPYDPDNPPKSGGILLRMNSRIIFDKDYNSAVVFNNEALPKGSNLLYRIPLSAGSERYFEILRFPIEPCPR